MTTIKDYKLPCGKWATCKRFSKSDKKTTKSYSVWCSMIARCNNKLNYRHCKISELFSDFQTFATWCQKQVGYGLPGYHLDKDILSDGIYSENTCVFIPSQLNLFLTDNRVNRGLWPQGVRYTKGTRPFRVDIKVDSVKKFIGSYATPEEAGLAYKIAKEGLAKVWAKRLYNGEFTIDARVYLAMKKYKFVQNNRVSQPPQYFPAAF